MTKYLLAILIGGAAGALLGAKGSCSTGTCPLTSNPYIGGLYGAGLGFLLVSMVLSPSAGTVADDPGGPVTAIATQREFQDTVLKSDVPVLVDVWASWCGPCRTQMPIVEALATRVGDKARVVKVNVDRAGEVADGLNVSSIPTLIIFRNGVETHRFVGVQSGETLAEALGA